MVRHAAKQDTLKVPIEANKIFHRVSMTIGVLGWGNDEAQRWRGGEALLVKQRAGRRTSEKAGSREERPRRRQQLPGHAELFAAAHGIMPKLFGFV